VKIQWTLDNTAQTDIAMTASGDVYSGTIPKQAINSVIAYSVVAQNSAGGEASVAGNYLVRDAAIVVDYTTLVINEVNGVDKWFEIYNTGSVAINLAGVTAHYSNSEPVSWNSTNTWTGSSDDEIPAGGFFSTTGTLGTGLSANNANVRLQLRAPDGTPLDTYEKLTNVNTGQGYDNLTNKSHVRVPDGTGVWYYTADGVGTKGTTNGISTAGYIKIGEEDGTGSEPDYTKLIVNEISGEHKYVEIYNSGTATIPLDGVKLQRNGGLSEWVGTATDEIPAGAHRIFLFNDYTPTATAPYTGTSTLVDKTTGLETYAQYAGWNVGSGISDQQILKIAVVDPDGVEVSVFIRGDEPLPAWGTGGAARVRTHSYSLISDGTWGYAVPTPGAENGAKVSEIINPGYLTAQP
jgi:hypothetical protein